MKEFDDKNTFTKRLSRYAKVNLTASSLATRYIVEKLTSTSDSSQQADLLYQALGTLRGPLMKIPQLLATIPDFLPPTYQDKFMKLQANIPPMGVLFVKRRMRSELGNSWQKNFQNFTLKASFAASLGQVHKAVLANGHVVACKLQYPNMPSSVEADLNQLRVLISLYKSVNTALDPEDVLNEINEYITHELDYIHESKNMAIYASIFQDNPSIMVPKPYKYLCTQRLLTMDWMEGTSILEHLNGPLVSRNDLARKMFHAWYQPLYSYGILHGDPHMGNYTIGKNNLINLLDFGCIRLFSQDIVKGIIELYRGLLANDQDRIYHAYELWGFKKLPKETLPILNRWATFLYGPLLQDRVVSISDEFSSKAGQKVAAEVLKSLSKHGGIKPPRSFVFMDRAAVGIGSIFLRLKAQLNWHQLYESYLENCYPEKIEEKRGYLLKNITD